MKTKEELNELKEEVETLNEKLHELTEEELAQVTGGARGASPQKDSLYIGTLLKIADNTKVAIK